MIEFEPAITSNALEQFTLPLYYFDHNRKPEQWATGFIVELKKQYFLVTAAHVRASREKAKGPLFYFYDHNKTMEIGNMTITKPNSKTGIDRWDLAVAKLPDGGGPPYEAVNKRAIGYHQLTPSLVPRSDWNYVAVGYPNSKNKVYQPKIEGRALIILSNSPSQDVYDSMSLDEQHLLIQYDRSFKSKSKIYPKIKGMSGGPIFAISDNEAPSNLTEVRVVAVSTDYFEDKNLIKGTDVAPLLFIIESLFKSNKK